MELQSVQWIQYQLDTAATIEEVIASLAKVRVAGTTPIHFFIADRSGATASVEFLDGKPAVHRTDAAAPGGAGGDPMSVPVLTNHTYEASRSFLNTCAGWGGSETIPDSPASLHRFARAATGLRSLQSLSRITGPADAFKILDGVAQEGATQWSIVYDLSALRVHFRTLGHQDVKTIDLADLDFACDTPVRMIDIDTAGAGNVRERWTDYTRAANRDLIGRAYGKTDFLKGVPPETLDLLAMYPEGARCAGDPR
jgi:choloylglycine hydrolase